MYNRSIEPEYTEPIQAKPADKPIIKRQLQPSNPAQQQREVILPKYTNKNYEKKYTNRQMDI